MLLWKQTVIRAVVAAGTVTVLVLVSGVTRHEQTELILLAAKAERPADGVLLVETARF